MCFKIYQKCFCGRGSAPDPAWGAYLQSYPRPTSYSCIWGREQGKRGEGRAEGKGDWEGGRAQVAPKMDGQDPSMIMPHVFIVNVDWDQAVGRPEVEKSGWDKTFLIYATITQMQLGRFKDGEHFLPAHKTGLSLVRTGKSNEAIFVWWWICSALCCASTSYEIINEKAIRNLNYMLQKSFYFMEGKTLVSVQSYKCCIYLQVVHARVGRGSSFLDQTQPDAGSIYARFIVLPSAAESFSLSMKWFF